MSPTETRAPDVVTMTMSDGRQYPQNADGMVNVETNGSGAWVLPDTLESMIEARDFEERVRSWSPAEIRTELTDAQESLELAYHQQAALAKEIDEFVARASEVYGSNRYRDWPANSEMHMRELEERGKQLEQDIAKYGDNVRIYEQALAKHGKPKDFEVPDPFKDRENRNYVNDFLSRSPIKEDDSDYPIDFGMLADDALTNAYDSAVEQGYATVREGAWKEQRIFEPVPPITAEELEDWVYAQAAHALPALFDGYGYDQNGNLYSFNH